MDILGISCYFHTAAAALVRDGRVVAAAPEERFSRQKNDARFPVRAIDFCLRSGGIDSRALDYVVFFEKPFLKFERILLSTLQAFPRSRALFTDAMVSWLGDKLWTKELLRHRLNVDPSQILFAEHHVSHAASAFFCSPFEDAAILTVDGVGEWATACFGVGRGSELALTREMRFPHSLGLLYSAFTAYLGFEVNEGEYKVMGMAGFGRPRFVDEVRKVIRVADDGSFELDMRYFSFHRSADRMFSRSFEQLFGPPRQPGAHFFTTAGGYPPYFGERPQDFGRRARANEGYADIAASLQAVTEDVLLRMARHAHATTGLPRLCVAGGVALNSVANGRLLRETPFTDIYIQPAAGDDGGAVGAALYAYHCVLGRPRGFIMNHAAWGEAYAPADVQAFVERLGIPHREHDSEDELLGAVSAALAEGKVVGWFHGRFEWGPRALGQRSILADPRRPEMKDVVNTKIKFREPYRPFAPAVPVTCARRFFALDEPERHYPARFMLYVVPVEPAAAPLVPATTHVDGTARLQVVHPDTTPRYHRLIERFGRDTGVPVVLNTSFNLKGEPIVASPADAWQTFLRTDMDVLVLENFVIEKTSI